MKSRIIFWNLFLSAICGVHAATVRYVDLNCTNPIPPFTNWATASTNIQDAVNFSGFGNLVLVTNGIYQSGGYSGSGSNRVYTLNPITIQSVNGPAVTMIKGIQVPGTTNGATAMRCVYLSDGCTLSGFTLTNGATTSFDYGGGVRCSSTNCLITNCVIVGNSAYDGGAGSYLGTLVNCVVKGNSAPTSSLANGGGSYNSTLINCLVSGNYAGYNSGGAAGGSLINCTVVSNVCGAGPGGVSGSCRNCIVYNNPAYLTNTDTGGPGSFTNCCLSFTTPNGANNFTNPPLFANLAGGDYHLNAASPCINAGSNSFITNATDLDGNPRIANGTVDIGAYEFQSFIRYVNASNSVPVSPFTNWTYAAANIQDAIDVANVGDFIVVTNGTYNQGARVVYGTSSNRVVINKAVTVQSVNGPAFTIISGTSGQAVRCAYLTNGALLSGFTLTNGVSGLSAATGNSNDWQGGGAWCESTSATISNCFLAHNFAFAFGGGCYQGTLINCIISSNTLQDGGGCGTCFANVSGSTFINNGFFRQPANGGGAFGGVISHCLMVSNSVFGGGGAAYQSIVNNCIISNNSASIGGGICYGVVNNSLLFGNQATGQTGSVGGGVFSNVVNNSILISNRADFGGGGARQSTLNNCTLIRNASGSSHGVLNNCILLYNYVSFSSVSNYQGDILNYCDTQPMPSNGVYNITNDAAFVNLAGFDFHLLSNSPCINSGNNAAITNSTDYDGNPRLVGSTVDIGAYEYQSPTSLISYAYLQQYGLQTDGSADFLDSDGDGFNNFQEWRTGTSPIDSSDYLKVLTAATNNPAGIIVTWKSVTGRNYLLQRSSNLSAPGSFATVQASIAGQPGSTSFADTNAIGTGPWFYRVGVQ